MFFLLYQWNVGIGSVVPYYLFGEKIRRVSFPLDKITAVFFILQNADNRILTEYRTSCAGVALGVQLVCYYRTSLALENILERIVILKSQRELEIDPCIEKSGQPCEVDRFTSQDGKLICRPVSVVILMSVGKITVQRGKCRRVPSPRQHAHR